MAVRRKPDHSRDARKRVYGYSIDAPTAVPSIDLVTEGENDKLVGIFELNEGRPRLSFAGKKGGERPGTFETGENRPFIVLKRKDDSPLEEPATHSLTVSSETTDQVVVVPTGDLSKPIPVSQDERVRFTFDEVSFREWTAKIMLRGPVELVRRLTRVDRVSGEAAAAVPPTKIQRGALLYYQRGCAQCHRTDERRKVGPGYVRTFGEELTFSDGTTARGDEAYIKNSIIDPQSQVRRNFPPVMPSFKGLLSEAELDALAAFIKSRHPDHKPADGEDATAPPPRHVEIEVQPKGKGDIGIQIEYASHPGGDSRTQRYHLLVE